MNQETLVWAQFLKAAADGDTAAVSGFLDQGVDIHVKDPSTGLNALMIASGYGKTDVVRQLLSRGADANVLDSLAGASALHKACQRGSLEAVKLLVEAGAFVNLQTTTTGHTPLMEAIWFKWPAIVEYLLQKNSGLNVYTHYGFSLREHFQYALNVSTRGKDKLLEIQKLLEDREASDQKKIEAQKLMSAVAANNLAEVKNLLQSGIDVEARYPVLNGFNDAHTPLLVASRDGYIEIVRELLKAGANVNATEPTFGAVPLHKATYNGHVEITALLAKQPNIDLNVQGPSNGYTPLHDALWHGFTECATTLMNAGARLDLKGHDGKTPLDIALEVYGPQDEIVHRIRLKMTTEKSETKRGSIL